MPANRTSRSKLGEQRSSRSAASSKARLGGKQFFATDGTPVAHASPGRVPSRADYQRLEEEYLRSLSIRKREKSLLSQELFDRVWDVLHNPKSTAIETAQFRFWARRMFSLSTAFSHGSYAQGSNGPDDGDVKTVILHEQRPVAVREQIYDILVYCHQATGHAGRDRTNVKVREYYSYIPKCLIAAFVKACPTCIAKKSGIDPSPAMPGEVENTPTFRHAHGIPAGPVCDGSAAQTPTIQWAAETPSLYKTEPSSPRLLASGVTLPSIYDLFSPSITQAPPPVAPQRSFQASFPTSRSLSLTTSLSGNNGFSWLSSLANQPGPNCHVTTNSNYSETPQTNTTIRDGCVLPPLPYSENKYEPSLSTTRFGPSTSPNDVYSALPPVYQCAPQYSPTSPDFGSRDSYTAISNIDPVLLD